MPALGIQVIDPGDSFIADELLADYGWNPIAVGGDGEADSSGVFTVLPGVAMLVNFSPTLSNVLAGGLRERPIISTTLPGAGANTAYHNFTFLAKEQIYEGQELFANVANTVSVACSVRCPD